MKKALALLVALTLLASLAVGSAGALASTPGKLLIWCSEAQVPALKPMAAEFQKKYGVPVMVTEMGFGDIRPNLITKGPSGEGPDLIVGPHDWLGELVANGAVAPIDLTANEESLFTGTAIKAFTYNGKLYGMPYAVEAIGLIYNKKLVPHPPKTLDELMAVAKKLTDPAKKEYGFLYPLGDAYHAYPFLSADGHYFFRLTSKGFDAKDIGIAQMVPGARIIATLTQSGLVPKGSDYNTMASLFQSGKVGMIMTGPWQIDSIKKAGIDYGVAKLPTIDGRPATPFVGVQGFMMSAFSKNKLLAMQFLRDFIMTKEGQLAIHKVDPRIPALKSAFEAVSSDPDLKAFGESAADGIPMPAIPEMAAVWTAVQNALTAITNGQTDPVTAMKTADAQVRKAIAQGTKK